MNSPVEPPRSNDTMTFRSLKSVISVLVTWSVICLIVRPSTLTAPMSGRNTVPSDVTVTVGVRSGSPMTRMSRTSPGWATYSVPCGACAPAGGSARAATSRVAASTRVRRASTPAMLTLHLIVFLRISEPLRRDRAFREDVVEFPVPGQRRAEVEAFDRPDGRLEHEHVPHGIHACAAAPPRLDADLLGAVGRPGVGHLPVLAHAPAA